MNNFSVAQHKILSVQGHDFIFLSADKAVFEIDEDIKGFIQDVDRSGAMKREEVLGVLPGSREENKELLQSLIKRRIIMPAGSQDGEHQPVPETPEDIPLKTLVLHVTDDCNLACKYCYHREGESERPGGGTMFQDVSRRSIDYLLEQSGNLESVTVVFFGGEPLLNFKLVRDAVGYARLRANEQGKTVDFSITTNGTLLNDQHIDFLVEHTFTTTVSLDGFQEVHDAWRVFPDGSPSYGKILPGVQKLLLQAPKPVAARATLVQRPERASAIVNHLLHIGFSEAGIAPVTSGKSDYQLSGLEMSTLLEQFAELSASFLRFAKDNKILGFSNLIDLLASIHEEHLKSYPCGAGLSLFAVDAQGTFFPCQRFSGSREFSMGNVFQGLDPVKVNVFRRETPVYRKQECRSCWVRTLCAGGCYNEAHVRTGSHLNPTSHYCDWIKRWTEIGLETYCHLALTSPKILDVLIRSRGAFA